MQKCVHFMTADSIILTITQPKFKSIAIGEKLQFMKKFNFQHQIITSLNCENKNNRHFYVLAAFHRAAIKNT